MKNLIPHSKRYLLRFYLRWYEYPYSGSGDWEEKSEKIRITDEEFDDKKELNESIALYDEIYKKSPAPVYHPTKLFDIRTGKSLTGKIFERYKNSESWHLKEEGVKRVVEHYDFLDGKAKFWGYVILDFEDKKILSVTGDVPKLLWKNWKTNLKLMDQLFRDPDEIPEDYKWDDGEYEGWLQFRWGNGLNAIEVEDKINEKKKSESKSTTPIRHLSISSDFEMENQFERDIEKELRNQKFNKSGW